MAIEVRNVVPGTNLDTTAGGTLLYAASAAEKATVTKATLTNHSATSATFSLWILPSGVGATADRYHIVDTRAIPGGATYDLAELRGQTLNSGDSIWGIASTATTLAIRINAQVVS